MIRNLPLILILAAVCACGPGNQLPVASPMDEEVNVGYGTTARKDLGYAVDKVKVDENVISSYSNITEYLRGRVPGVEVAPNGSIQIRGKNSINSPTEALVLVDGAECRDLRSINPRDIQSIEVLKDASAAIYGSRGANGVVLITTKAFYETKQSEEAERKAQREAAQAARKAEREARKAARKANH